MADGPVRWGTPPPARKPGIYVVELGAPRPSAPLELTRVGKWLERLPGLRLDGKRPNSRALNARLSSFWWPGATVLFAGVAERTIGGRAAALYNHVPGDRQPHPDGQWLHLLRGMEVLGARLYWAETDAAEEYLDAILDTFGAATGPALPDRPAAALDLPWANSRRANGRATAARDHGLVPARRSLARRSRSGTSSISRRAMRTGLVSKTVAPERRAAARDPARRRS